jgi:hypothetical protein
MAARALTRERPLFRAFQRVFRRFHPVFRPFQPAPGASRGSDLRARWRWQRIVEAQVADGPDPAHGPGAESSWA